MTSPITQLLSALGTAGQVAQQQHLGTLQGQAQAGQTQFQRDMLKAQLMRQMLLEESLAGYRTGRVGAMDEANRIREELGTGLNDIRGQRERDQATNARDLLAIRQQLADIAQQRGADYGQFVDWRTSAPPSGAPGSGADQRSRSAAMLRRIAYYSAPHKDPTDPLGMRLMPPEPFDVALSDARRDVESAYGTPNAAAGGPPANVGNPEALARTMQQGTTALGAFGQTSGMPAPVPPVGTPPTGWEGAEPTGGPPPGPGADMQHPNRYQLLREMGMSHDAAAGEAGVTGAPVPDSGSPPIESPASQSFQSQRPDFQTRKAQLRAQGMSRDSARAQLVRENYLSPDGMTLLPATEGGP